MALDRDCSPAPQMHVVVCSHVEANGNGESVMEKVFLEAHPANGREGGKSRDSFGCAS